MNKAFRESKWRDSKRNLNRRRSPLERALHSFRLIRSPSFACSDAPLGRRSARSPPGFLVPNQRFCRFFRFFPHPSGICPVFPAFPCFCRLFSCFAACFRMGLNRTFERFLHFYRFNHPLQPPGLQHYELSCLGILVTVFVHIFRSAVNISVQPCNDAMIKHRARVICSLLAVERNLPEYILPFCDNLFMPRCDDLHDITKLTLRYM